MAKYTDTKNSLIYETIYKPSIKLTNGQIVGGNYQYTNDDRDIIPGSPIINAIDINWGSVVLNYLSVNGNATTSISTTSELLKYLETLNNNIAYNKIKGIQINDKYYTFENGTAIIDGLLDDIKITAASINNNIQISPDENGVLDISSIIYPLKENIDQISASVNTINEIVNEHTSAIETIAASLASIDISSFASLATVAISGSYNDLLDKPVIPDEDSLYNNVNIKIEEGINAGFATLLNSSTIATLITSNIENYLATLDIEGVDGATGLSAYEVWLDKWKSDNPGAGTEPTIEDYLLDITGPKGATGEPGSSIYIKGSAEDCTEPGDSYVFIDDDRQSYLIALIGKDDNGEPIWSDPANLNVKIEPGKQPRINNEGNWEWYDPELKEYISTVLDNGVPTTFPARGPEGTKGKNAYEVALDEFLTSHYGATPGDYYSYDEWYSRFLPFIIDNGERGVWGVYSYPSAKNVEGADTYQILEYKPTGSETPIIAQAIGKNGAPGLPGTSPIIVELEENGATSLIWEIWNESLGDFVPATDAHNNVITAQGKDGRPGSNLEICAHDLDDLIQEGTDNYIIYDPVNNTYSTNEDADRKSTYMSSDNYIGLIVDKALTSADSLYRLLNTRYQGPGIYYLSKNDYTWYYAGKVFGEDGLPGKSAYEIALELEIDKYNSDPNNTSIDKTNYIDRINDLPEFIRTATAWINSLQATTISATAQQEIIDTVIASVTDELDFISTVIINNDNSITQLSGSTLTVSLHGDNIPINSNTPSTIAETINELGASIDNITVNNGTLAIEINNESTIIFTANTDGSATVNLPSVVGDIISDNTTISNLKSSVIALSTSVASINDALGFDESDWENLTTLKNVINEIIEPGSTEGIPTVTTILDSIGNKLKDISLIVGSSDGENVVTINLDINNSTADLSNTLVTGIKINNGNIATPATGIVNIELDYASQLTYTEIVDDGNGGTTEVVNTYTPNNNVISLNDFTQTLLNKVSSIVNEATTNLGNENDEKYLAKTDNYVSGIKVYTGATATADIIAETGTVVLSLNEFAKKMQIILTNYTKPTVVNDKIEYEIGTATINIDDGTNTTIDLSGYATKADINNIEITIGSVTTDISNNYYNKEYIDNSMKWNVITN